MPVQIDDRLSLIDEARRESGLATVRDLNLNRVASTLVEFGLKPGDRILDVGSAHGWFLEICQDLGFEGVGIEPDSNIAATSDLAQVRVGYFPDVLERGERFAAITFNDVLEHIPILEQAVESSFAHLEPGGLLSVNIPNSRGPIFLIARVLARLGVKAPFHRLWQTGLPSPHLWYIDQHGLTRICEQTGFETLLLTHLVTVSRDGLWDRVHLDREPSVVSRAAFAFTWAFSPFLSSRRHGDILHAVFRRPRDPSISAKPRSGVAEGS